MITLKEIVIQQPYIATSISGVVGWDSKNKAIDQLFADLGISNKSEFKYGAVKYVTLDTSNMSPTQVVKIIRGIQKANIDLDISFQRNTDYWENDISFSILGNKLELEQFLNQEYL